MKFNAQLLPILLLMAISCTQQPEKTNRPPNIVFIMTDDHAYQAISAYGSTLIETPNIDRLAAEGVRFDKSFVTNSICSPSRATALTGKFSHLNGVRDNLDVFDSTQMTFPKILQAHNYHTAVIGKWHLKSEPTGFDFWKVLPDQGHYYNPEFRTPKGIEATQGYVTDQITTATLDYLDEIQNTEKPFLLMYHHKAPHRQWWPSMDDLNAYRSTVFPVPTTLFDTYENRGQAAKTAEMRIADHMALSADNKIKPELLEKMNINEFSDWYTTAYTERYNRLNATEQKQWDAVYDPINSQFENSLLEGDRLTRWKYQRYLEDYLGSLRSVDRNIGRLLTYLDEHNLTENTLVVYTSDQGFYLGEHGWFDKRLMYEPSFRTPLIMRLPSRIPPGTVNKHLVQNIDYAPTFLDLANITIPKEMQGKSLVPLFEKNSEPWRDELYYHYYEYPGIHMVKRHYGIRTERYKLIHFYYDVDEWELYDLARDPEEMNNVYGTKEYQIVQEELHQRLNKLRTKYGDNSDTQNQYYIDKDIQRLKDMGWYKE